MFLFARDLMECLLADLSEKRMSHHEGKFSLYCVHEYSSHLFLRSSQGRKIRGTDLSCSVPREGKTLVTISLFQNYATSKSRNIFLHCTENPIYEFLEINLCDRFPNSYIHVSVLEITRPDSYISGNT